MSADYPGNCHCRAIGYIYRTSRPVSEWQVRACQCSFCRAHDALCTSDPHGSVQLQHQDPQQLMRYRFALRTADFLVCRVCGVYIGALIETPRGPFATINTRTLRDCKQFLAPEPAIYDAEDSKARVARREARWTPLLGA